MKTFPLTKIAATAMILFAGIISWLIANIGVDTGNMEMAAIANVVLPALVAIIAILLFLLIDWRIKKIRVYATLISIILNLLCGIIIRIESADFIK